MAFLLLFVLLRVAVGQFRRTVLPEWVGNAGFRYTVQFGLGLPFAGGLGTLPTVDRTVLRESTGSTRLEPVPYWSLVPYAVVWAIGVVLVLLTLPWLLSPEAYPRVLDLLGGIPFVAGVSASGPVWLGLAVTATTASSSPSSRNCSTRRRGDTAAGTRR
ncbi:hypothetical protein BRC93_13125 [Halobacteriales archaeon QS_5_70_15]|nr:MAG: hypothetical protein BRC93_13125 [Halobacteriales archaeon QS_5_70_15]